MKTVLWKLNPVNTGSFTGQPYIKGLRVDSIPSLLTVDPPPLVGNTIVVKVSQQYCQPGVVELLQSTVNALRRLPPLRGNRVHWSPETGFVPKAGDVGLTYTRLELAFDDSGVREYVAIGQWLTHVMVFQGFEKDSEGNPHPIGMFELLSHQRAVLESLILAESAR